MISFIIVNYNCKKEVLCAINAITKTVLIENFEIVIIDNASIDGSKECFEMLANGNSCIIYYYCNENFGFSKANNIGARLASGDILVIINPDVDIEIKGIDNFINNNLSESVGVLAPQLIYPDGSIQPNSNGFSSVLTYILYSFRIGYFARKFNLINIIKKVISRFDFMQNTIIGKYLNNYNRLNQAVIECDWVSGACMIIRKNLFEVVGGFDENIFMYSEDEDLCRRIAKLGYKTLLNNSFKIVHYEGYIKAGSASLLDRSYKERIKSSIYYIYKYCGKYKGKLMKLYFAVYIVIKGFLNIFKFKFKSVFNHFIFAKELLIKKY
jgi:GT2 family glycosyltransferase